MRLLHIGVHTSLVLKLAMHCSSASSLLALVWPQVNSRSNLICVAGILTSSFLTHVVLKVSVTLRFANHCPGGCSTCDLALRAMWTACDVVWC